jgi:hypothetical protein
MGASASLRRSLGSSPRASARVGVVVQAPAVVAGVVMVGWIRLHYDGEKYDVLCVEEDIEPCPE